MYNRSEKFSNLNIDNNTFKIKESFLRNFRQDKHGAEYHVNLIKDV